MVEAIQPVLMIPDEVKRKRSGAARAGSPRRSIFARKAAAREEPDLFDLAWGFRGALGRSLALAAVQVYGLLLLSANCWFYLSHRSLPLVILGAAQCYLALFWLAMILYQWPLLAEQEIPTRQIVRKSALLALDNAPFTLALSALVVTVDRHFQSWQLIM